MKKVTTMLAALCALVAVSAYAAPADEKPVATNSWSAVVGDAAKDPAVLKSTLASLQSDKGAQLKFIAAVNGAISQMSVSPEAQGKFFANTAKTALESVSKDNIEAAVAEIYATVPVEQLRVVNEVLSKTCFNRGADATASYTDADFQKKAEKIMSAVSARTAQGGTDNASQRDTLAIDMLVKSSGGKPDGLAGALADKFVPEGDRAVAKDTWLPDAAKNDYSAINASAGVEEDSEPDMSRIVIGTTGASETGASLLASIATGEEASGGVFATPLDTMFNDLQDGLVNDGLWRVPAQRATGDEGEQAPPVPPTPPTPHGGLRP